MVFNFPTVSGKYTLAGYFGAEPRPHYTAAQLMKRWAVTRDPRRRRDAGLRFLTTVGEHLVHPFSGPQLLEDVRYPNIVYHVNGEIAQIEQELIALVGLRTRDFQSTFANIVAHGMETQSKFFITPRRIVAVELSIERCASMLTFFGQYIDRNSVSLHGAISMTLRAMRNTVGCYVDETDLKVWHRQLEHVKLFASRRPEGPITRQELLGLEGQLDTLSRSPVDSELRESMVDRVRTMQRALTVHFGSALA